MKYLLPVLFLALVTSCVTLPKNLRIPENPESAVIGVSIRTVTLKIFKNKQNIVYFVRLDDDEKEGVIGSRVLPANFVKGEYAYLVNARPGRYVAVASVFFQTENSYNSLFDKEIITRTITDVGPGEFVFMGAIQVENRLKSLYQNIERHGDKEQLHYFNLLRPVMYGTFYTGSLINADRTPQAEQSFLAVARDHFKDSEWLPRIAKRKEELETTQ
jgi:hypothetical protein